MIRARPCSPWSTFVAALAFATAASSCGADEPDPPPDRGEVTHFFGFTTLAPYEEALPCASWTLNNEQPLYVSKATIYNQGMYHHSTWMAVPDHFFGGPDGFWDCDERGWSEVEAALSGTVLIAQSTQSLYEEQQFGAEGEGVVVKVPAHARILAQNHMLNVSNREVSTGMTMALEVIHPRDVTTILKPFRFAYWDLFIPGSEDGEPKESDHTMACDMRDAYQGAAGDALDIKIHFILPHTHDLGKRFFVDVVGGSLDGERIVNLLGFNAQGNGVRFDEPIDLSGAEGLRLTCGFANARDEPIEWGIGDQEMCEFLAMADTKAVMDMGVNQSTALVDTLEDGTEVWSGPCDVVAFPPNSTQSMPSQEEIDGPLYLPPAEDGPVPEPVPPCEPFDPDTEAELPATLTSLSQTIFPSCAWSSCHANGGTAGLDLTAADLHDELLNHQVAANVDMPLVDPGNPDNSWLYRRVAECEPKDDSGNTLPSMPLGTPALHDPALVAKLRAWIEDGALDN